MERVVGLYIKIVLIRIPNLAFQHLQSHFIHFQMWIAIATSKAEENVLILKWDNQSTSHILVVIDYKSSLDALYSR